jgi:NAD-dependent SIR2 family protein deacetylase
MSKSKMPEELIKFYCENCNKYSMGEKKGNWMMHPPNCPDCGSKWKPKFYNKKTGEYE